MKLPTKLFFAACAAALLGVNPLAAQERLPAPGGAKPVTPPAPAQGAIAPAPGYQYQPACCQPDCCGNKGGCYVLAEAVFVKPRSDSFDGFLTNNANGDAVLHNFDFDFDIAPRITIGWSNCDGLGVRFRWFHYEDDATLSATIAGIDTAQAGGSPIVLIDRSIYQSDQQFFADVFSQSRGNRVDAQTNLRIRVYDIEGTQSLEMGSASLVLSAGIRFIDNESSLETGEFAGTVFVEDGYRVRFDQRGWGPTISAEGRMCLGCITPFVNVRTSYLLSKTDVTVESADDQNYSTSRDDGLFIAEASLGAEWTHDCCYGRLFVRGGFEVQLWKDAGLATRVGDNFSRNSNLYLEGFTIGVGFAH